MYKVSEIPPVVKYVIVGALAFTTEYSSFLLLINVVSTGKVIIAQTVSFCLGLLVSFLGSRLFTFKNTAKSYHHGERMQLISYALLAGMNLLLTNIFIHVLIEQIGLVYWIAKVMVMLSVVAWNYVILNKLIFKSS